MTKTGLLKIINPILVISALIQAFTGLAFFFNLFKGSGEILEFLGEVHKHNGLILAALIALHLILNWGWVKANFFKR